MAKSIKCLTVLVSACFSLFGLASAASATSSLTFTAFNIEWYGLDGDMQGNLGDERRTTAIRNFLDANGGWSDVMAFEEVVDVELLQNKLVPANYRCASYHHDNPKHQHVVICVKSPLRLEMASDDDNYTLENVSLGQHRPAVHGIVTTASGEPLVHVIAVHLKARPDESAKRKQQVTYIADYLKNSDNDVPLVLMGDWNTFNSDVSDFNNIYRNAGLDLSLAALDSTFTWRRGNSAKGSTFDRIWTEGLTPVGKVKVLGPCNLPQSRGPEITRYNNAVSDHCAIKATLRR